MGATSGRRVSPLLEESTVLNITSEKAATTPWLSGRVRKKGTPRVRQCRYDPHLGAGKESRAWTGRPAQSQTRSSPTPDQNYHGLAAERYPREAPRLTGWSRWTTSWHSLALLVPGDPERRERSCPGFEGGPTFSRKPSEAVKLRAELTIGSPLLPDLHTTHQCLQRTGSLRTWCR